MDDDDEDDSTDDDDDDDADDRLIIHICMNASRSLLTVSQHFTCRKVAISMACERRFSRSR